MVFKIASSPFTHNQRSTARIMMLVCLAALPGIAMQWYWFGWGTLIQVVLGIVSAMAAEALVLRLRKKSVQSHLGDNSALLTGLLLGISIPPLAPWWMVVVGMVFAIIIAKQLYGGLGNNPFNPAMIGYVVLLIAFPVQMTSWLPPQSIAATVPGFVDSLQVIFHGATATGGTMDTLRMGVDGISQATPLDIFKTGLHAGHSAEQLLSAPIYAARLQASAGSGLTWPIWRAACSCCGAALFAGISRRLPGGFGRLLHARLAYLPGKMPVADGAPVLRRDHAWRILYSDRPGHRLYHQPWQTDFRGAGWPAGLADSYLRRLSGRRGVRRIAGQHYRAVD
ncbi:Na(+)-translocating NADH-quinone reductase subunit B [Cedecea neteri]|uniref:Na(+)-translocating NADH-quinone reductase subunit B n=1 Tax=Cedecea neteri TaxID=158822 RepID=A0A2X3L331_9ENTR|nr:Na(+)-translocating NADH-quinone reductase subunit B [Cedecea neteri]